MIQNFINKYSDMINVKHNMIEYNDELVKDEFDVSLKDEFIGRLKFHIIIRLECTEFLVTEFRFVKEATDDDYVLVLYHDILDETMRFDDFVSVVITNKKSFF